MPALQSPGSARTIRNANSATRRPRTMNSNTNKPVDTAAINAYFAIPFSERIKGKSLATVIEESGSQYMTLAQFLQTEVGTLWLSTKLATLLI
jgi:hypothetical protein